MKLNLTGLLVAVFCATIGLGMTGCAKSDSQPDNEGTTSQTQGLETQGLETQAPETQSPQILDSEDQVAGTHPVELQGVWL